MIVTSRNILDCVQYLKSEKLVEFTTDDTTESELLLKNIREYAKKKNLEFSKDDIECILLIIMFKDSFSTNLKRAEIIAKVRCQL